MVIYNNANSKIEAHKLKLGLTGDVYMVGHYIESLASHKVLMPTSTVTTIEEAEQERISYEAEQARIRSEQNAGGTEGELIWQN